MAAEPRRQPLVSHHAAVPPDQAGPLGGRLSTAWPRCCESGWHGPLCRSRSRLKFAPGELIDKITILEIKSEQITDAAKRHHVGTELAVLVEARDHAMPDSAELTRLAAELKAVNETLWRIEDAIRLCERDEDFGPRFIALARSVYHTNDRRAAVKRQVNELLGSRLIEEKSYATYGD